jgi:hypothetical protein
MQRIYLSSSHQAAHWSGWGCRRWATECAGVGRYVSGSLTRVALEHLLRDLAHVDLLGRGHHERAARAEDEAQQGKAQNQPHAKHCRQASVAGPQDAKARCNWAASATGQAAGDEAGGFQKMYMMGPSKQHEKRQRCVMRPAAAAPCGWRWAQHRLQLLRRLAREISQNAMDAMGHHAIRKPSGALRRAAPRARHILALAAAAAASCWGGHMASAPGRAVREALEARRH